MIPLKIVYLLSFVLALRLSALPLSIEVPAPAVPEGGALYVAFDAGPGFGSSVVSVDEARRLFLPFQADKLVKIENGAVVGVWSYEDFRWQAADAASVRVVAEDADALQLEWGKTRKTDGIRKVQWFVTGADGELAIDKKHFQGGGDEVYLPHYYEPGASGEWVLRGRFGDPHTKFRIYQMLPRLFGNANEQRTINGTLLENGSGQFNDLSEAVLAELQAYGYTHIWLTGVLQQATSTDYSEVGQAADDPDLLKGIAGSPYAIRDYFDVSPDYAEDPARRLEEFRELTERMQAVGLKTVIDFVPNHVARSYASDIRPELAFGVSDRKSVFFEPRNNFFYLTEEVVEGAGPLRLPTVDAQTGKVVNETARLVGKADGFFLPEKEHGRVTGNNVVSWRPSEGDWYETVKLNYGYDFLNPDRLPEYPSAVTPRKTIPDTWKKMDAIIAYWQEFGVDGFRVDMAHMVPPEFWKWLIHRARERDADVFFFAEAYDNDPAKVASREPTLRPSDNVMLLLLDAGFDAVYDDPGYDTLEHIYNAGAWANDLQDVQAKLGPFFFDRAVRYAENHDEIRLAHPESWGGQDMHVGRPVTATLFGLSRGPVMIYHGQEVGEPALGREGFGGDDQRTTIFDYWSMPEFNKWWNEGAADGGGLSEAQSALRAWYSRLLHLQTEPAFADGNFIPLNHANRDNPFFGKVEDVGPSGHWMFAYLRSEPETNNAYLVTSNFHPDATLRHVRVRLPEAAVRALELDAAHGKWLVARERLAEDGQPVRAMRVSDALREGLYLDGLQPLSAYYWELQLVSDLPEGAVVTASLPTGNAYLGASPLLRLQAGTTATMDLRRHGNPGKTHHYAVESVEGISASIDPLNHKLYLEVDADARGLRRVPLRLESLGAQQPSIESSLLVAVDAVPVHTFRLEGWGDAGSVAVVGNFNSWNSGAHPMKREGDAWVCPVALGAGQYDYKYVVDGQWMPDPGNDSRRPDGHGGFNSLLSVEGSGGTAPLLFVSQVGEQSLIIEADQVPATVIAEALPETGGVFKLPVAVNDTVIEVDTSGAPAGTLVRVVAESAQGQVGLPAIAFAGGARGDIWQDDIIYYAFTDRFHDGEVSNTVKVEHPEVLEMANYFGGDFQGIEQKIKEGYFKDLGVNVLWLAPLNQNPGDAWAEYLPPYRHYTGYHGYWPVSRFGVESRFGGDAALRSLIKGAKDREMKVLADLVLKHVHSTHPIRSERPDLFGQLELSDGSRNLRRWNDKPFTTWFEPFLPAFDFRNPESIEYLLEDATYWIEAYGLDGYRLDAVKHIRPDFWWRFRSRMRDTFPGANHYFVGETFQDRAGISAFVGSNMLDGQFDFPLYDVLIPTFAQGTTGFDVLEKALRQSEESYGRSVRMSPLIGNHDKPRFMAYADGDLPDPEEPDEEGVGWSRQIVVDNPAAYDKLKMAMTFLMTIDGVPMIYYGDEIGMTGAGDPDNRRMMRFGDAVTADEAAVREHFAALAHTRRAHPALYLGSRRVLQADDSTYAYLRAHEADRALVVFNRSDEPAYFSLQLNPEISDAVMTDALSGQTIETRAGHVTFELAPMQSALFVNGEEPHAR
jgi:glycosidase